jgi:hypothetical protein
MNSHYKCLKHFMSNIKMTDALHGIPGTPVPLDDRNNGQMTVRSVSGETVDA